ncbi:MAG: MoaD/ThiS family protein [Pseudomonadota bacterium]
MNIRVKLFATLREGRGKEVLLETHENATAVDIFNFLGINMKDVAIFLINGRDGKLEQSLSENDLLAVFPPLGGG